MDTQIIAMGGGGFSMEPDHLLLDRYILDQARSEKPKVCFLPTASGDADGYIERFLRAFENLPCQPTYLSLYRPPHSLESFVLDQDIIYVGGGNTKNLLALWKEWGLDAILYRAWKKGVILAGLSAGSICWFEQGLTDSYPGKISPITCLGFLNGSNCPHYDGEEARRPAYHRYLMDRSIKEGMAADDGVALHYMNGRLERIVSSRKDASAYCLKLKDGRVHEERINPLFLG
ncbi:peptidase E [Pseudalkalibacillus salsuginis]|uniref:Type 1 glutamine amidotransferase-like domain-containing protein n=1 Tax=Pseudalkalibacillus salsuginis TaxID=2910972 RepID=UPI001F2BE478|nr:peptidase E [Pseudalkalibacillus salsuginis]MCF6410727.1 peptidase E [Pseudalkalibacillus salsuginis]